MFKVGDKVVYKTVEIVVQDAYMMVKSINGDRILCEWIDDHGCVQEQWFDQTDLSSLVDSNKRVWDTVDENAEASRKKLQQDADDW